MCDQTTDNIQSIYKLSPMQEGIMFNWILDENTQAYYIQMYFEINNHVSLDYLQESFDILIERHDILRTNFFYKNVKNMWQIVYKDVKNNIVYFNLEGKNEKYKNEFISKVKENDKLKNFDLSKDRLIRITLIRNEENRYSFIVSFHHIILDGWSIGILINEFIYIYKNIKNGKNITLEKSIPYKEYIDWIEKQDKTESLNYWKGYLAGYDRIAQIPKILYKKSTNLYLPKYFSLQLPEDLSREISELATNNNTTLNAVIQTIWGILLQKYNNVDDVVFGTIVSGRPADISGIERMVGLTINNVPVRIQSKPDMKFISLLRRVNEELIKAQRYHYCSLAEIQTTSILKNNLLDHVLVFENYPFLDNENSGKDITFQNSKTKEQTNYDFSIIVLPGKRITFKFYYNEQVYQEEYICRIAKNFMYLVQDVVIHSDSEIQTLSLFDDKDILGLVKEFNNTKVKFKTEKTVAKLFEEQVKKTPGNIAAVYMNQQITYEKLNMKANTIACKLRDSGIKNEDHVVIIAEKSIEMIIGIYGVIKSGAAYIPIDVSYPKDRIQYILKDCKPKAILLYGNDIDCDILEETKVFELERFENIKDTEKNLNLNGSSDQLMYIIYTSGTTGKPKGVMVENKGIINLRKYFKDTLKVTEEDRVLQFANISFDVSAWEINMALLCGAMLVIPPQEYALEPESMIEYCKNNKVTIANLTPNYYSRVHNLDLKMLITGGTEPSPNILERMKNIRYINAYGPTEATICATYWEFKNKSEVYEKIPIGKPILNTQIYILRGLELCDIGMIGELCIAGVGIARGYLNRPDLSKNKFVDNPFIEGEKMYRTGDMARWLLDGNIEFLGRADQQVKIRGYRIELGEIESVIRNIEGVQDVAVITNNSTDDERSILAFLVSNVTLNVEKIREILRRKLPAYMIPNFIIQVSKIPLTLNGKIDLRALQNSKDYSLMQKNKQEITNARNVTELKMIHIWRELLAIDNISIDDNFFEIGGNSLLLIKMINEIKKEFRKAIPVKEIYTKCSIRFISQFLINNNTILETGEFETNENIVLMKRGNKNSKNIFFIPDGTGDPSAFIYIADQISNDFTCWGLVYDTHNNVYPQDINMQEEAMRMIKQIKRVQKEGSYNFVAFCSGGYIATEIISLLECEKTRVNHAMYIEVMPLEFKNKKLDALYPDLQDYSVSNEIKFVQNNLKGITYDRNAKTTQEFWNKIIDLNRTIEPRRLDSIKEDIDPIFKTSRNDFVSMNFEQLIKHINTIRSAQNAVVRCKRENKKYLLKTEIDFIFASEQLQYKDEFSNWNKIFINASKYNIVKGTHFGIMKEGGSIEIAKMINENFK